MKPVLDWIKSNILIVVLAVVAIGALVGGWFVSSAMNAGVRARAETRARALTELTKLEKTEITLNIPGKDPVSKMVVPNKPLLEEYQRITEKLTKDADEVHGLALERNRRDHKPVMTGVFPQPPAAQRETIANAMHKELVTAYESLLASINGGMPPSTEQLSEDLARRELQYVQSTLQKASREALTADEQIDLRAELTKSRLAIYGEHAQRIGMYIAPAAIDIPVSPENKALPTLGALFDWQWKFWITSDILGALADANAASDSGAAGVLGNPVKQVLAIKIPDSGFAGRPSQPTGSAPSRGSSGFGGGGDASGAPPAGSAGADQPLTAPVINQTAEAKRNYSRNFTGRITSPLYDVREAEVVLIAETARLPEIFNALARRNFMTVVDVTVKPADAFEAAREGLVYGKAPVSEVTMKIESVWLREWTAPLMPAEVRTALGVTAPAAGAADGDAPPVS